jgi:SP family sugar:H+ symporter-like MFS transporter
MGIMRFFKKKTDPNPVTPTPGEITPSDKASPLETPAEITAAPTPANQSRMSLPLQTQQSSPVATEDSDKKALKDHPVTVLAALLGSIASIGGFMFGYESGQISGMSLIQHPQFSYKLISTEGFLAMSNFLDRFGENGQFTPVRQGTIVALLCAGTLVGCLVSGWICDRIGRRYTISFSAFFYIIGVIIEITSSTYWVQFAMGRFAAGLGIGALSTSVPMYQSESVPKNIRGAVVASYQLAITLGIWTAYMVRYPLREVQSTSSSHVPDCWPVF